MHNLIDWLRECHRILQHPAHRAERPLHVIYFVLVGFYAGGPYGVAAMGCALVTILSWEEPPHA